MSLDVAIAVERVSKSYGAFRAVHDLTFEVYSGQIFALLGPNGSGKTTTIRMILDILKPDTGTIRVLGGPLTEATKDRIGYLPEERGLYRNVPVLEMMMYLGSLKGLSSGEARRRSLDLLERLQLAEHAKKKVSELSKGMQQKVQFGVTVLHDPALIIIDEPFYGLDPVNTRLVKDLLRESRDRGAAIVMSTHQMDRVEELCERMCMFNQGRVVLYGPVTEVRRRWAPNAVIVQGQGNWEQVAGVERVEFVDGAVELWLDEHAEPRAVLRELANRSDVELDRYEVATPSLDDIFIAVVEGHERVQRRSERSPSEAVEV